MCMSNEYSCLQGRSDQEMRERYGLMIVRGRAKWRGRTGNKLRAKRRQRQHDREEGRGRTKGKWEKKRGSKRGGREKIDKKPHVLDPGLILIWCWRSTSLSRCLLTDSQMCWENNRWWPCCLNSEHAGEKAQMADGCTVRQPKRGQVGEGRGLKKWKERETEREKWRIKEVSGGR